MGDAEIRKQAADEAGRCPSAERDHVPGDFTVHLNGEVTCHWCGEEVTVDG